MTRTRRRAHGRARTPLIQSLQRGLGILETVAAHGTGVTLAEVSRARDLHASTAFHLLRTLVALGYLVQDDATRRYRLGPRVFRVAAGGGGEGHLSEMAGPHLAALARQTGETSHLAVFERGEVVVIDKVDGANPVRVVERVGYPRPAHCTAIGKVLLAHLGPEEAEAFFERAALPALTARTITSPTGLLAELRRVRARGYGIDNEEFVAGVRCVAAPIWSFRGRVVAAVGISGPAWRLTSTRVTRLAKAVVRTARQVSDRLGHRTTGVRSGTP